MTTALDPLVDLLRGLENRPISSSERFQIESEVLYFANENKLKADSPILQSLTERLSFSYFPTVSNLKKFVPEAKPPLSNGVGAADTSKQDSAGSSGHRDYYNLALQPALQDVFYTCNIRRYKSALSTSYRMYIKCVRSLKDTTDGSGYFDNGSSGAPVMIFGAKKLKNGSALIITSPQAESKDREWKDKDAVGKITRSGTGYTYMGRLNTDRSTGDRNSSHSQDVTVASYDPIVENSSIHGLQKSSSDGSISLNGSRALSGPVAVSISSSGSEKLIQASVVVADTAIVDRFIEDSELFTELEKIKEIFLIPARRKSTTASVLSAVSQPVHEASDFTKFFPLGLMGLQSKLPRQIPAMQQGTFSGGAHSVSFGSGSRVKSASRKNIVIDKLSEIGLVQNDWIVDTKAHPPIFQLGKISEEEFCLDFHQISPFQAFVICMATFDK